MRLRSLALLTALTAATALAEKSTVNLHLQPSIGPGLNKSAVVMGVALKVDVALIKAICGTSFCLSPQLELFGMGAMNNQFLNAGQMFGLGIGVRMRLFNDERGYLIYPGSKGRRGNLWGNHWVDAHLTLADVTNVVGFDVATGVELSLLEGLSVGPFAKFQWTTPYQILLFGLSFTIGAPQITPAEADYDNDGVKGDADKCPDEPEDLDGVDDTDGCADNDNDKDGVIDSDDKCPAEAEDKDDFQDDDGCPEADNDKDGLLDADDSCPNEAGSKETKGCPKQDKDADGVVDSEDKCPEEKGVKENAGCPDTDKDGDTVVDRLDACPAEKGDVHNKGCPYPDTDKDTVVDPYDNCPTESGPASNQGCPEKVKQLVAITAEKIVIKDKVYFDTDKATIQKKSFALLDQVANVLKNHDNIKLVQVEGHTDSTGDAEANKKLSQARAESVTEYLAKKGVAASRLRAVGFGLERPADTNDTPAGRENNRRVEFNIVEQ